MFSIHSYKAPTPCCLKSGTAPSEKMFRHAPLLLLFCQNLSRRYRNILALTHCHRAKFDDIVFPKSSTCGTPTAGADDWHRLEAIDWNALFEIPFWYSSAVLQDTQNPSRTAHKDSLTAVLPPPMASNIHDVSPCARREQRRCCFAQSCRRVSTP
jgi:hypothetical protein